MVGCWVRSGCSVVPGCGRVLVSLPGLEQEGSPTMRGCTGGSACPVPCPVLWECGGCPGSGGDVSCPSGWSGSPGQGDLGSRDALSLGYLGVPDCEPAFFLAW